MGVCMEVNKFSIFSIHECVYYIILKLRAKKEGAVGALLDKVVFNVVYNTSYGEDSVHNRS